MTLGFCKYCKHYKPHKPMKTRFVFGNWVGDGRCLIGRKKKDYATVETDSCEHWEQGRRIGVGPGYTDPVARKLEYSKREGGD